MLKKTVLGSMLNTLALLAVVAHGAEPQNLDIPPGDLAPALESLARQTGLELVFQPSDLVGLKTRGVHGKLTPQDAVARLISGTSLTIRTNSAGAILVSPPAAGSHTASNAGAPLTGADSELSRSGLRLAQADQVAATGTAAAADTSANTAGGGAAGPAQLEEIVVTAQKRAERLQDVPVPVTALQASELAATNQLRLQDYYTQVPGFIVTPSVNGLTTLTIRGVTSGGLANPTVAVTVDDVPFGTSNITAGGLLVPDLDPSDLSRIEVLRGPQGTLYGASSLGGLFKYVTLDPSTDGVSGRVQAGLSTVYGGDRAGYNVRGSINVPISETVALRASAFHRVDPGYIDNVKSGQHDVNRSVSDGGHLSLLVKPSDDFSLKFAALIQQLKDDGSSDVDVPTAGYPQTNGLGNLQQTRLRGSGWLKDTVQLYSATLKGRVGAVDLTSVTGYGINSENNSLDYTYLVSSVMQKLFNVSGAPFLNQYYTTKVSEEVRAAMPLGERIEWLMGGFYTSERTHLAQNIAAADAASGAIVNSWSLTEVLLRYKEYAAFTDFTVHLTDRFDIQLGARESHIDVPFGAATEIGPRFAGGQVIVPANESSANAFTYLLTPEYKFSRDLMAYARFASGYRPGAPNTGAGVALGVVPSSYSPDKTHNYEAGVKGDFLDHRVSIDASLYYIDWKDIQLTLLSAQTGQSYVGNAGAAKSEGVELSTQVRPVDNLTLSAWVSYDDAVLTQAFPKTSSVVGFPGEELPTSARWSGTLSIDERLPITSKLAGFVGGSLAYVGNRVGPFLAKGAARAAFPSYSDLNLNAGVNYEAWTGTLFVNNVTDRRGVLNGGAGYFPPFGYSYIMPRTVGVNIARSF